MPAAPVVTYVPKAKPKPKAKPAPKPKGGKKK